MLGHVQAESIELNQNIDHLRAHLVRLDTILRMGVARAKAVGFTLDDEFQGLYIDESEIQQHLDTTPGAGLWDHGTVDLSAWQQVERAQFAEITAMEQSAPPDHNYRLLRLADSFNLSPAERDFFLLALAPELDRRYERIYAFIQDDVVKRRPTVDLALNLLSNTFGERLAAWSLFGPDSPLIRHDLLIVYPDPSQREPSLLSHFLRVDARVVNYVLGYDYPDVRLVNAVERTVPARQNAARLDEMIITDTRREQLRGSVQSNPIYYFYGTYGAALKETALALADWAGLPLVSADLVRLKAQITEGTTIGLSFERLVRLSFRDARLSGAALYLDGWASVLDDRQAAPPWLIQLIVEYPNLIFLGGTENWEPHATDRDRPIFRIDFPVPEYDERLRHWETHVYSVKDYVPDLALPELADKFRLMPGQIRDAVRTGRDIAAWKNNGLLTMTELYAGSRAQSNRKLSNLAQKITPKYTWNDIVLPEDRTEQLREMCNQVQYGHRVYDEWGFGGKLANAEGITALFAGQSGTGKTMSAEIMAAALGLELYKIDLSTVVSKYIGETEKNLSAIFNEAAQSNAILFFDEADALFGKRSEVKDSHDRYANIEIGYLLQRMETYDGITILATNLRQNLDEAFTRRIDFLVDFPFPEEPDRLKIWKVTFPKNAPIADDVDLNLIARRYRMAGGNIRNAVLASAFLAAADGEPKIKQRHLVHAIRREHQKMGKLLEEEPANGFDYEEEAFEDFEEG